MSKMQKETDKMRELLIELYGNEKKEISKIELVDAGGDVCAEICKGVTSSEELDYICKFTSVFIGKVIDILFDEKEVENE